MQKGDYKEIELNFVNKIKYIKKNYKQSIQEYAFLFRHILNNFCPQILFFWLGLPPIKYKPFRWREHRHRHKLEILESIFSVERLES